MFSLFKKKQEISKSDLEGNASSKNAGQDSLADQKNPKQKEKNDRINAANVEVISNSAAAELIKDVDIHIMPSKFVAAQKDEFPIKRIAVIFGGIIISFFLVSAAVIAIIKYRAGKANDSAPEVRPKLNYPEPKNAPQSATSIINIATSSQDVIKEDDPDISASAPIEIATTTLDIATSTIDIVSTSTLSDIATTTPIDIASPTPISAATTTDATATTTPIDIASPTSISAATTTDATATTTSEVLDSDNDGLTDAEEALFATNKFNLDTDEDGYLDGLELINLYDPVASAPALLTGNAAVKEYNETRYSILYPSSWETQVLEQGKILFKADNGEFIQLSVYPNEEGIGLHEWYAIQILQPLEISSIELEEVYNKKFMKGIKPDDSTIYFNDYNYIYILTYNSTATGLINYPAIFRMMREGLESKIDTDGDDILDHEEVDFYGTDSKNIDTDGDGYNDGEEILGGYDPLR